MNYYEKELSFSLKTELKIRTFFALFCLSPFYHKKVDLGSIVRETKQRMQDLKSFLAQHAGWFISDPEMKAYLQIPHIDFSRPLRGRGLINYLLSEDFLPDLEQEVSEEIDRLIFFTTRIMTHKSYLTKIYDFYMKNKNQKMQK